MMKVLWLLALAMIVASPLSAKPKSAPLPPIVKRVVNAIMAGDPAPLKGAMTPAVEQGLTRQVMQAIKQQYVTPKGDLRSAAVTSTQTVQGMKVTLFVMRMQKGELRWSLAQDSAGKVAGLHALP